MFRGEHLVAARSGFELLPMTPTSPINLPFHHSLPMATRSTKQSGLVSLACTECRKQHLKCDARKPSCSRCLQNELICQYLPSRRGGRRKPRQDANRRPEEMNVSTLRRADDANGDRDTTADLVLELSHDACGGVRATSHAGQYVTATDCSQQPSDWPGAMADGSPKESYGHRTEPVNSEPLVS